VTGIQDEVIADFWPRSEQWV